MARFSIPLLFVVSAVTSCTLGCSFEVGTAKPASPPPAPAPAAHPAAAPAPAANTGPAKIIGRSNGGPGHPAVAPTTPVTPPATGIPVMTGTNLFGTGTADVTGWKGSFYNVPAGTTHVPALANVTPNGILFAKELNVSPKPMTGGFPGIDPARNENFAIRWEAPLIVDTEADYTFRLVSDDGSILTIDGTSIVDNDGAHGPADKSGPVHLVKGTHAIAIDYFQGGGGVALQLFCKKSGGTEVTCPTHLL